MEPEEIEIGKPVIYYSVLVSDDEKLYPKHTRIRSNVWPLGSGELVCAVEGVAGGVSLKHLEPA